MLSYIKIAFDRHNTMRFGIKLPIDGSKACIYPPFPFYEKIKKTLLLWIQKSIQIEIFPFCLYQMKWLVCYGQKLKENIGSLSQCLKSPYIFFLKMIFFWYWEGITWPFSGYILNSFIASLSNWNLCKKLYTFAMSTSGLHICWLSNHI